MRKYTYIRYITVAQAVSVMADSVDDAIEKVINADLPTLPNNCEAQTYDPGIDPPQFLEAEEVKESLDDMEERARQLINEYYDREECDLDSKSHPSFMIRTYETEGGRIVDYRYEPTTAESYYVSEESITIYTAEHDDIDISELSDTDRYEVLKDIIHSYEPGNS